MRAKKTLEIKQFDNFEKNNGKARVEKFYNYQLNGELCNAQGVQNASFPAELNSEQMITIDYSTAPDVTSWKGLVYFHQYFPNTDSTTRRLFLYGDDNKLYLNQLFLETDELLWLFNLTFEKTPIALEFKKEDADAIILADKSKMMVWETNYAPYTINNVPVITSMCMNEGVLFCTIVEPNFKIWYATNLDLENVGQISSFSGYVTLEDELGPSRKVLTFNEDVYVFRDYGISKLINTKGEVDAVQVYKSNSKILCDTVAICGNSIIFMTNEGFLYSFNGLKVTKLEVDIRAMLTKQSIYSMASSLGDKYYLAVRLNFGDNVTLGCETVTGFHNNALVVIDSSTGSFQIIRGVDVNYMLPLKAENVEKMLLTFNCFNADKVGEICDEPKLFSAYQTRLWKSAKLFDDTNTKLITKLVVDGGEDVTVNIIADGVNKSFSLTKNGLNAFNFKICAKDASLEIVSNGEKGYVDNIKLEYYDC